MGAEWDRLSALLVAGAGGEAGGEGVVVEQPALAVAVAAAGTEVGLAAAGRTAAGRAAVGRAARG